jgi:hypothetical protein
MTDMRIALKDEAKQRLRAAAGFLVTDEPCSMKRGDLAKMGGFDGEDYAAICQR